MKELYYFAAGTLCGGVSFYFLGHYLGARAYKFTSALKQAGKDVKAGL